MSNTEDSVLPTNMMVIGNCRQPSNIQTSSALVLNNSFVEKEVQKIGDELFGKSEQELNTNTLKKITYPISPFKKKSKARTGFMLDERVDHQNQPSSIQFQNGLKVVSIDDDVLCEDVVDVDGEKKIEPVKEIGGNAYSTTISKHSVIPNLHSGLGISNNVLANNKMTTLVKDTNYTDPEEQRRISYMNLLNLSKTENVGVRNVDDKTERSKHFADVKIMADESHDIVLKKNTEETHLGLSMKARRKRVTSKDLTRVEVEDDREDATDINWTIMNKKKKFVDRIKRTINNYQPVAKENIDLSIVKEELPETVSVDVNAKEDTTEDLPLVPTQRTEVKMEPSNNFTLEENDIASVSHFMALPVMRQNAKQKMILTDHQGKVPDNDCVIVHKLVCLICKKTEMVSVKKSSVQGNIFLCKTCSNLFDKSGEMEGVIESSKFSILDVTCIRCNLTFSSSLEVELHNKEMHNNTDRAPSRSRRHIKPQYCSDCNRTFNETDEICTHIKSRRHKCEYCYKLFSTNSDLKKHINIHTNEKTYMCIYCSKTFNSRGNMVKHLETHKERERSFKCEFCNKTFLKADHLKVHVNTHTNEKLYECPYCKKTFNRKYCLQLHINIHTLEKIYECHFCNKICMDPSTLRKHIATHSDQRPFKCEFCDKMFKQKPHLTAHMKMHDIKQTFSCSYCDKVFFSKNTLRVHINTHTHEKTFLCIYCKKTFTSKSNLLTHINNKHTVDRTYNCAYCSKVFTDPSTVKKHENIHTNELTYQCAYCDKVFLRKTHLRSHINMHIKYKPYKCKLCDKSFAIKSYLKVHNNIHKGVKPFKCKQCGKAFTSKSNLILHTNSHTKERLFQCSYCRKDFTQKANLKGHISRSHMDMVVSPTEN